MRVDLMGARCIPRSPSGASCPPSGWVRRSEVVMGSRSSRAPMPGSREPPAEGRQRDAESRGKWVVQHLGGGAERVAHHLVLENHLAGHVPEDSPAEPYDPPV